MLGETVCYINRPGVALMRGVKALREGKIYEEREGEGWGRRQGQMENVEKERKQVTYISTLRTSLMVDIFTYLYNTS